jgi:hypothetical protein
LRLQDFHSFQAVGSQMAVIKKSKDVIGNRTRDLPEYSILPGATTHRIPHITIIYLYPYMIDFFKISINFVNL